jgi:hypothetical protein
MSEEVTLSGWLSEVPHGIPFFQHLYGVTGDPGEFAALAPLCPVFRVEEAGG